MFNLPLQDGKFYSQPYSPNPPPFFAEGGKVNHKALRAMVNAVRAHGEGGDTVLAHISPEEAHILSARYGSSINPETGLPQFGLFKKIGKALRNAAPIIGTIAGNMIGGGPVGGTAGGALGGMIANKRNKKTGKRNVLDNLLEGAKIGGIGSGIIGLGNMMLGNKWDSGLPDVFGLRPKLGLEEAPLEDQEAHEKTPSQGGPFGLQGLLNAKNLGNLLGSSNQGPLSSIFKDPLSLALLASTVGGTLLGKQQKEEVPDHIKAILEGKKADDEKPLQRVRYAPRKRNTAMVTDEPYNYFDNPQPEYYNEGGYIKGSHGGQADTVETTVPEDGYVWDADFVSQLGDGNTEAGAALLRKKEQTLIKGKSSEKARRIPAKLSTGEVVWGPEAVKAAGGPKALDKVRERLRKQKRGVSAKKIPPKSKPFEHYVRG